MGCGISPDYFLDKMQWYEIDACLNGLEHKKRDSWEQTRFISYITAQTQSAKKLKPTDILTFSWDNEDTDSTISNTDIQRLKEKATQTLNIL